MLPDVNSLPILVLITRKCNGTVAEVKKIVQILNDGGVYPLASEVSTELRQNCDFSHLKRLLLQFPLSISRIA